MHYVGQDNSTFKAYACETNEWVIRGVCRSRKKADGLGEMVSAFQDEQRGFGMKLFQEELEKMNTFHAWHLPPRLPLEISPGKRFFKYSKQREGCWGFAEFKA